MKKPNIIYILADDMGYGDVRALNPECKFPTPNLDRLAHEGMYFSDAHSSSAVCTPSRYSILTGRYCWRTYLKRGVLNGWSGPLLEPGRLTVAELLRQKGYRTACVGKWHLGWEWGLPDGQTALAEKADSPQPRREPKAIDYTKPLKGGPTDCGFDYFYGIAASLDMPPYVYVENDRPVTTPTAWATAREFCRAGPRQESMRAHNVLGDLTAKAVDYIKAQSAAQPFFLYFPLNAPHTPIAPAPEFMGASKISLYADFCMEVDARVGEIMAAVKAAGLDEDTLIIFTTDNGASQGPNECAILEQHFGHYCSHIYRGYKSDIWEGGHRLPFLMRWPAMIKPGGKCEQSVGIFDLFATAAELVDYAVPADAGEDSVSLLPALRGAALLEERREGLIHHSIEGLFAIRQGRWKLCRCGGSGGWSMPREPDAKLASLPPLQLYDVQADPEEKHNLAASNPEVVRELTAKLHRIVARGRSTPGAALANAATELADWQQLNWLPEIPPQFVLDD